MYQCRPFSLFAVARWARLPILWLIFSTALAQQSQLGVSSIKSDSGAPPAVSTTPTAKILAQDPSGAFISVADVFAELRRARPEDRQAILSKPDMAQQLASNLLVRRMLAIEDERDGRATDPVIAASIAIARDRVLSDDRLARLDVKNSPNDNAIEAYARDYYQANRAKFEKPTQTRASHILLPKDSADSLMKAKDLLAQLRAGASFEDMAKAHSIDPGSAARGGGLGFFQAGKMVPSFDQAVDKLVKPGDLSDVIESDFGYHIIRLDERQDKTVRPYVEVREQLHREAVTALMNESRVQMARKLTSGFSFDRDAIESLTKSALQ